MTGDRLCLGKNGVVGGKEKIGKDFQRAGLFVLHVGEFQLEKLVHTEREKIFRQETNTHSHELDRVVCITISEIAEIGHLDASLGGLRFDNWALHEPQLLTNLMVAFVFRHLVQQLQLVKMTNPVYN